MTKEEIVKKWDKYVWNEVKEATRDYFAPITAIYNYFKRIR